MYKDEDYLKAKMLTKLVEEEALLKIKGGYKIEDVISSYMYTVTKLLATMVMTAKVLENSDFDEESFIDNSIGLMKDTIKNHIEKGTDIIDKINEVLNN